MARRILATALVITLAPLDLVFAQTGVIASRGTIRESINRDVAKQMLVNVSTVPSQSAKPRISSETTAPAFQLMGPFIGRRGSFKQQVFATIGAVAGLFGGGYLGVKIEGDRCHCDDPGLAGGLIGASIGAIAGGVVGFKLGK
jgi:uncharacterized protein YcfJ